MLIRAIRSQRKITAISFTMHTHVLQEFYYDSEGSTCKRCCCTICILVRKITMALVNVHLRLINKILHITFSLKPISIVQLNSQITSSIWLRSIPIYIGLRLYERWSWSSPHLLGAERLKQKKPSHSPPGPWIQRDYVSLPNLLQRILE